MSVTTGLQAASTPNYSIDDILKFTQQPPPKTGGFRKVLGGIVGGVGNVVAPGLGSAIGGLISGGGGSQLNASGLLGNDTMQFLELQRQMQTESRAFETASTVLKVRHDAAMSSIRNMK
jgi:hypothetical protein